MQNSYTADDEWPTDDVIMQSVKGNVYKAHNFITTIFFSEKNVYKALRET